MKFCLLLGLVLLVGLSEQVPKFNHCTDNITTEPALQDSCHEVTCYGDALVSKPCPEMECGENQKRVGERPADNSKVYPDCCGAAICE